MRTIEEKHSYLLDESILDSQLNRNIKLNMCLSVFLDNWSEISIQFAFKVLFKPETAFATDTIW